MLQNSLYHLRWCPWLLHTSLITSDGDNSKIIEIKTFIPEHTCNDIHYASHHQAGVALISSTIQGRLQDQPTYSPIHVKHHAHWEQGVHRVIRPLGAPKNHRRHVSWPGWLLMWENPNTQPELTRFKLSQLGSDTTRRPIYRDRVVFGHNLQYATHERDRYPFYTLKAIFWLIVIWSLINQKLWKFKMILLRYFPTNSTLQNFDFVFHFIVRFIQKKKILIKNCDYCVGLHIIIAIFDEYFFLNESYYVWSERQNQNSEEWNLLEISQEDHFKFS